MSSLDDVETRLRVLLDRYRPDLVDGTIYGMPSLTWPGAKAHDYFAAVKRGATFVSLYLLVADTYPDALDDSSPALLARRTGKATFRFSSLDDELGADLAALLDRLYDRYRADHSA
jgi:hypothetical protein